MTKEINRIRKILELTNRFPAITKSGIDATIGIEYLDDCAVVPISESYDLVIGSDFVRGAGFTLFEKKVISWEDIGYYLVGANASDIAAMGGTPAGIVVVVRYTKNMEDEEFEKIMTGVTKACQKFNMPLLGGDTGGYETSVLSASAFGTCPKGRALLRKNGKAGDKLFVTGTVGNAGAALAYFSRAVPSGIRINKSDEEELALSWKRIEPALLHGQILTKEKLSKCAIDTSDGLKAACRQIAEPSKVDVILYPEAIPISESTKKVADAMSIDPLTLSISDSVDFRLLFTISKELCSHVRKVFQDYNLTLYEIGEIRKTKNIPNVYFDLQGTLMPVNAVEWDQSEELSIDKILRNRKAGN